MALQRGAASTVMGEYSSSNTLFRQGVKAVSPGEKMGNLRIRLLPDFNESLSHADPAYLTSWVPYRQHGVMNPTTGREEFSGFFIMLRTYRFWGRQQSTFFSPSCLDIDLNSLPEDRIDPIALCREVARKDGRWKHLTEKPTGPDTDKFDKAVLHSPGPQAFMNAITWQQSQTGVVMLETMANSIVCLSGMGFELLTKQLDWLTTAEATREQLDPAWNMYLLGDVMSPTWGRVGWFTQQATEGNKNQQIWTIKFTGQDQRLLGSQVAPMSPEQINPYLAGRYNLGDTDKVLHIMKPQEIVEMMLVDGSVPRDLIAHACAHIANVPGGGGPTFAAASTTHPGMTAPPANPFGGAAPAGPAAPAGNPFAAPAMQAPVNPFGGAAAGPPAMPAQAPANPFGGAPAAPAMATAPFGSGAPVAANPFGGALDAPFGGAPAAPMPAAANPFGGPPVAPAMAPPMPPAEPVAPPMAPVAPPAPVEPQDWFIWEGDRTTGKAVLSTRTQLLAAAAANPKVMVCSTAPGASWKIPSEYGIAEAPAPAATPGAPPVQPPVASAPAPAGTPLTAEEREEMARLVAATAHTQPDLPTLQRILVLQERAKLG